MRLATRVKNPSNARPTRKIAPVTYALPQVARRQVLRQQRDEEIQRSHRQVIFPDTEVKNNTFETPKIPNNIIIILTLVVIATLCNVLSTGGVYWAHYRSTNQTDGLWVTCKDGKCFKMVGEPTWLVCCQYLFISSCILSCIVVVMIISTFAYEEPRYRYTIIMCVGALIASSIAIGVYTYMISYKNDITFGYSYILAAVNVLLWFSGTIGMICKTIR